MQLIEINGFIPHIQRAPHKIYIVVFDLPELSGFKVAPKAILRRMEPFEDVDEKTNISVDGIDGDKGEYSHDGVRITHGIIMDFRPMMIKIVYWEKQLEADENIQPLVNVIADKIPVIRA